MDSVAIALPLVQEQLDIDNKKYNIKVTSPTRDLDKLDNNTLYVIRQKVDADGMYHFIVAAKMAKGKNM